MSAAPAARRVTPPRVCPECGADRWLVRSAHRTHEELSNARRDIEKLAQKNGLLTYQLADAKAKVAHVQSLLQRKVVRQSRVIRRLEKRLRDVGNRPYEDAPIEETSTGAEYDAVRVLPGEKSE